MRLHYLVKLKIRVFCGNSNVGKNETQEILLIDFDFTYINRCSFLTLTSRYGKFNHLIYLGQHVPNFITIGHVL